MKSQPAVRTYIEDIIKQQNIDPFTSEGQKLARFLFQELDRFTKESVINALPASKLDEFAELISSRPTSESVHQFAQTNIPNLEQVFFQTFQQFQNFYLRKEVDHALP